MVHNNVHVHVGTAGVCVCVCCERAKRLVPYHPKHKFLPEQRHEAFNFHRKLKLLELLRNPNPLPSGCGARNTGGDSAHSAALP